MALGWLWVALHTSFRPSTPGATLALASPQHPKWNQPRKGARDAARHSRSRSQNSLDAETQRFAEGRREGRKKRLFSSAFLRALCVSALILLSPIPHLSRQMAHLPSNRLRTVVFQADLKAGFCPALASSGPVCPGIALLLAHCLAARPLPPAYGLGDGAKPPENRQTLPVDALHQLWQDGAGMNESEKQFSFTRAASSTSGRAKNQIPISSTAPRWFNYQLDCNSYEI